MVTLVNGNDGITRQAYGTIARSLHKSILRNSISINDTFWMMYIKMIMQTVHSNIGNLVLMRWTLALNLYRLNLNIIISIYGTILMENIIYKDNLIVWA